MKLRVVETEFEAKLVPPAGSPAPRRASAKIEWKRYAGGSRRFDVKVRKLDKGLHGELTVRVAGASVAIVAVTGGAGRLDLRSEDAVEVPDVQAGDAVEIVHGTAVLLAGTFVLD